MLSLYAEAIGQIESSGNYSARGPRTRRGDRAYGKYQVMGANIPKWTKEVLGRRMKPAEFLADPQAQDAVFQAKFGEYVRRTGSPDDAASMWFTGKPLAQGGGRRDVTGTSGNEYVRRFRQAVQSAAPQFASVDPGASVPSGQADPRASVRPPERPGDLDAMLSPPDNQTRAEQLAAQTVGAKYNPSADTLTPADRAVGQPAPPIRAPLPPGVYPPNMPRRPITPTPQRYQLGNPNASLDDLLATVDPGPREGVIPGPVNRFGDKPLPGLPRNMGVPTASMIERARAPVDAAPPGVPAQRSPMGGPMNAAMRPDPVTAIDPQYGRGNIADNPAFPPQPRQNPYGAMAAIPDSNPSFRHPLPVHGVLPGSAPIPAPPPSFGNQLAGVRSPAPSVSGGGGGPSSGGSGLASLASLLGAFGGGEQQEAPPLMPAPMTPLAMLLPVPDPFRGYS